MNNEDSQKPSGAETARLLTSTSTMPQVHFKEDNFEADYPLKGNLAKMPNKNRFIPSARQVLMAQAMCVLLALLPVMAYNIWLEGQDARDKQIEELQLTVQRLATLQATLASSTESLLLAISLAPAVQTSNASGVYNFLERLDRQQPLYDGFAVFTPSGDTLAGVYDGLPRLRPADAIRNTEYFIQSLSREGLHVGRVLKLENGRSILPISMTVTNRSGRVQNVVLAALSMTRLNEIIQSKTRVDSSEIYFFDKNFEPIFGTGAENPRSDPAGLPPDADIVRSNAAARLQMANSGEFLPTVISTLAEGRTQSTSVFHLDGPTGTFASAAMSLRIGGDTPYMYIVAIAKEMTWAEFVFQRYTLQLVVIIVFAFLLLFLARFLGARYFASGLERLEQIAVVTREGNLSQRCGPVSGCRELHTLGASFDHMLETLENKTHELYLLSHTDPLTGLWNRRHFTSAAHQQISLATRQQFCVSVIMADIDHFKLINDTYGHAAGDLVLQQFAAVFLSHVRASDLLARYGGEEFVLLLPGINRPGVMSFMEKIRHLAENMCVLTPEGDKVVFTVSFGGTVHQPKQNEDTKGLLLQLQARADSALYASKSNGRNRSTLAE